MADPLPGADGQNSASSVVKPGLVARWRARPRRLAALGILLLLAGALLAWSRGEGARAWMHSITGEESWWEQVKGSTALALLSLSGPELDLAPDASIAYSAGGDFGMNTFLQLEPDPENVRRSVALMRDGGIGWARQHFPWEDIEIHGPGDFEDRRHEPYRSAWDKYDRLVKLADDHGVQILARLDDPPNWAYADPEAEGAGKGPPDDLETYGNFVAAVVERYCGQIRYYQIWNEPNIYPEWGEADVDPAGYAELLKLAAGRARAACPEAQIVSAAMAPNTEPGGRNMDDLKYLSQLYELGWQSDYDVLAAQAFGLWTGPTDRRASADRTNFSRPMLLRDLMVRNGDAAKPIWITEMGWDSPPPEMDAPYGRVSEAQRAAYTVAAYERIAAEWPWVDVAFLWFLRRPDMEWHQRPEGYFRAVEPDWSTLPTWDALAELATKPPVLQRGRHRPDEPALLYSGPWRPQPRDGLLEQQVGTESAEMMLAFQGTGIEILLQPPPERVGAREEQGAGEAGSELEDAESEGDDAEEPEPAASAAAGMESELAFFVVLDGDYESRVPEQVGDRLRLSIADLEPGEHDLILRVDGGEAWIDELRVLAPNPPSPWGPLIRVLAFGLAALIGLGLGRLTRRSKRARNMPNEEEAT